MSDDQIRLLIIEDYMPDAELLIRHLEKSDILFTYTVIDKLDLIDVHIANHEIDVIVCDYNLPGFTGVDAIQRIKALDKDIPVILISGAILDEQAIEAVISGAKDYVLKDNLTRLAPAIKREFEALIEKRENEKTNLFLNSLFDSQIGVLISDEEHQIKDVNDTYCNFLGYTKEEFKALPLPYIFPEYIRKDITDTYSTFIKTGTSEVYESKNLCKDGRHINVIASSKKVTTYDSTYVLSTVIDITKRKSDEKKILIQNQELTQLKETREKLYSIIGHDLKNALFGISGMMGIILDSVSQNNETINSASVIEKLNLLYTSSLNASRLLENLLEWVQIQSGNLFLRKSDYDISVQISEIIHLLSAQSSHKGILVEHDLADQALVHADHHMIGTVIRNLISNAIKFTDTGGSIKVSSLKNPGIVTLHIEDDGIGIPSDMAASLFDADNRPKRAGTNSEKGNGLGLLLVKELVERHNGTVDFSSKEGKGTKFTITLPA